ncbi:hypothetical protein F5I97DRAFT_1977292 [Phlebopus sp. FC_14]|nr:hypothetical protein F5I97DRAFT_1977292 [Phlebopus sp. FC_14]
MASDIGIKYTLHNFSSGTISQPTRDSLTSLGVKFVRVQWVDLLNNVRFRVLPLSHFLKLLKTPRPGVAVTKCVFGLVFIQLVPGFDAVGEYLYAVDLSSLRLCPYAPGHAVVFGFFQEKTPLLGPNGPSFQVPLCPRTNLQQLLTYAKVNLDAQFLVGFETEFILLKSTNPIVAANNYGWSNSPALLTGTVEAQVLEEIAGALAEAGIELQMYHSEAAPGQYEVVTGPLPPLEAADALVQTRETIFNIASKHGLRATLAPRLNADNCGSGAHTHISVHGSSRGVSNSEYLNPLESSFLAGLLEHLPSIIAFTLPLRASYERMKDGIWSGGTWACWGVDNREAPVRLANATSPSSRNFEIKTVDGTSSPYLALLGLLGAGILGINENKALVARNCEGPKTAAQMTDAERAAMGITKRMPLNIEQARDYLQADEAVKDILGPKFVDMFIKVNETLVTAMDGPEGENKDVTNVRLVENY